MYILERSPRPRTGADLPAELTRAVMLLDRLGVPSAVFSTTGVRIRRSAAAIDLLATRADEWGRIADRVQSRGWTADGAITPTERTSVPGVVYSTLRHGDDHLLVVFHPAPPPAASDVPCWAPLTVRERQVAECIASGRTSREVAACLGISVHTARRHTERLYTKLGVRRRADVARMAIGR